MNSKKIPKMIKFILILLTLFACSSSLFVTGSATENVNEEKNKIIKISDAEDLADLAEKCTLDSWSQGKIIELQADIYLDDTFLPIPTFGGIFDGNGHSIAGLDITESVSPAGVFGVLQEGAVVKNLNVTGSVAPTGQKNSVGGIVGENYGRIQNCTFTGTVSGQTNVGGISGINGSTGTVQNCRMNGSVFGENMTGGMVGYNRGIIIKGKNDASVNNRSVDPSISLDDLDISADVTKLNTLELMSIASDTGGIAGYSTGVIEDCSNKGTVGYPHIGYNLGGIAGRSCGYISGCINEGEIYGRKDLGGIVGQMEPYIAVQLSESGIAEIKRELDSLNGMLDSAERHMNESAADLQDGVEELRLYIAQIEETLSADFPDTSAQNDRLRDLMGKVYIFTGRLELLGKEVVEDADTLGRDLNNIGEQSGRLSDTFESVMQEAEDTVLSDIIADISEFHPEEATYGKVAKSENAGAVYGDMNVGGIAGSISLEQELDPEDDVTVELSMKERRQYELTAIIHGCVNTATVTAKKDYAGGICGRMDLGLIIGCEGYGYIYSESGDYVGGIAGLTGSTVRNSYAKCSLGGRNYIGGIVGAGITEDATGESSLVSGCYSLVDIRGYQQFAGAIAGVEAGEYLDCYFVSEDLPGINRTSYAGKAEPITYEELTEVKGLPEAFEKFTLTFVAGDEVVYAATFEYGDSFDEDIYPVLYGADGFNVRWDTAELKNLKKDTVVTAVYAQYLTTLASEEVRAENRSVFLAEGQFSEGASILIEEKEINFLPEEEQGFWDKLNTHRVVEQWSIEIPDDGLLIHTLRYLAPEEERDSLDIYVKQDGAWKLANRETVGSYLLFNIAGTEAEIAVVATSGMWQIWLLGAVLVCLAIGGGIWMVHKKKSILKWFIWVAAVLVLIVAVLLVLALWEGKLKGGVEAYQLLKEYAEQPEQAMKLKLQAELGEEEVDLEAEVLCTQLDGQAVTCIEQSGVKFFYADGILYLENGNAYQASEVSADYADLLNQTVLLYEYVDIETEKAENAKTYKIMVKEDSTQQILKYLLPSISEDTLKVQLLQVEMLAKGGALSSVTFSSEGNYKGNSAEDYSVTATLEIADPKAMEIEIPEEVQETILSGNPEIQAVITKDVFRLYAAWKTLYAKDPLGMQIYLTADCGPLALKEDVILITTLEEDTRISCIRKNDFSVYFTKDTVCSENGYSVTAKKAEAVEVADLLGIAYGLCLKGTFSCTEVDGTYIYSLTLGEEAMEEIAFAITQKSADMGIRFENGSIQVRIADDKVESIVFVCDGSLDILLTEVSVAFSAELDMTGEEQYEGFVVPEKVLEALKK